MNILLDARDLIDLAERSQPTTVEQFGEFLRARNHEVVLSFTNVRELVSTIAVNQDFFRVRPWLQAIEGIPHRYVREILGPRDEIQAALDAFNGGFPYRSPNLFVRRWDETLMPLAEERRSAIEELVNVRLDDIVYWIYQAQREIFSPPERWVRGLQIQFEEDRRALQERRAPSEEHFVRAIQRHSARNRIELPPGREGEFARWIYDDPHRCPGIRLGFEVYRALMENFDDVPEVGDFSDLAHIYVVPYLDSATLDRRMRHYCRVATERMLARGSVIDYRPRIYDNLGTFIGRNS